MQINRADVAELVDARDLNALRLLKGLTFFGKRDLAFGINLPERSEIWKTFLGASDRPYSRHAACGHAHCARAAGTSLPMHRLHARGAQIVEQALFPLAPTLDHIGMVCRKAEDLPVLADPLGMKISRSQGRIGSNPGHATPDSCD
jgi:hypothetical protein